MRKVSVSLLILIIGSLTFAQKPELTATRNAGFHKLTFTVELNKKSYLPLEPIYAKFKVTNHTNDSLAAERPQFFHDSRLRVVNQRGEEVEVSRLSASSGGTIPLPGRRFVLSPLGFYEDESVLAIDPHILWEPGVYRLQFTLYGGEKPIKSNVIEVTVDPPRGVDAEAFAFLASNGEDAWFGQAFMDDTKAPILKRFVELYSGSAYGEYAIFALANFYGNRNELDKAITELEKLASSKNALLVKQTEKVLADLRRKASSEKEKLHR